MRSLFAKLLVWFIGTALVTMFAVLMLAALTADDDDARRPVIAALLDLQFEDAKQAYLVGGRPALAAHLERFHAMKSTQACLLDRAGHDLVTGEDRSGLMQSAGERNGLMGFRRPMSYLARRDDQAGFFYIVMAPRRNLVRWFFQPEHIATMAVVIILLCWMFARHLTQPVRELQTAVECFGRGELNQRVDSTRGDELGQLGRTFNRMADRIESLLLSQRRLLADISHELRSPLARLSLAVELARTSPEPGPHLDRIEKEADRLNSLVNQLLQVTRAEGDPSRLKLEPVDLPDLIQGVVEDARVEAHARGGDVVLTEAEGSPTTGDAEMIRRAVENVVRNALRYEPTGGQVEVRLHGCHITVRDHGPGVPEQSLPYIFDPFYRVDSDRDRSSGGVGLGLSIAQRAIALHKGTIRARNADPGLEVTIELPEATSPVPEPSLSSAA